MVTNSLTTLGIAFYDTVRGYGAGDRDARHAAVAYMRRKDADVGDAMPYYEALAVALADRAQARIKAAGTLAEMPPEGGRQ